MIRRTAFALLAIIAVTAGRADAVTIRDLLELSKAGLSEQVLLALIEVDGGVFRIDTKTLKDLKAAGVTEPVIVALIRSGRQRPVDASAEPIDAQPEAREPQVIVIDHHDAAPAPAPVAVPYPVAVPVYVPTSSRRLQSRETVTTTIQTDAGLVKARVPVPANCVKAQPVYWGFGGKLRPDTWQQPPTVVCR